MRYLLALLLALTFTLTVQATVDRYVATTGNDTTGDGSQGNPWLTVTNAQFQLRLVDHSTQPANVWISGGRYFTTASIDLVASDSGSAGNPVTYRAMPGETPRIISGKLITGWSAVTDGALLARLSAPAQAAVRVADYTGSGAVDPPRRHGFQVDTGGTFTPVFCDGLPATVARYPNTGYLLTGAVTAATNFACADPFPFTWAADTNIMCAGYWIREYAKNWEFVTLAGSTVSVVPVGFTDTIVAGNRYFFEGAFEAIDAPGEYYLDRPNKLIYLWPPSDIATCEVIIPNNTSTFWLAGTAFVDLEGLTIECAKSYCVRITTSAHDTAIRNCTIRNSGRSGIDTSTTLSCYNLTVDGCTITDAGMAGVTMRTGTRTTLVSGGSTVTNCTILRWGAVDPNYKAAVELDGVSNLVVNCKMFNSQHQGVLIFGNENRILGNEIAGVCTDVGDGGAIYAANDFTYAGNVIAFNTIRDVGHGANVSIANAGVFLDNSASGNTVISNTFLHCDYPVKNGGGKSNAYTRNTFYDCTTANPAYLVGGYANTTNALITALNAMPYTSAPWSTRYPWLASITIGNILQPTASTVVNNRQFGGSTTYTIGDSADSYMTITNNLGLRSVRTRGHF